MALALRFLQHSHTKRAPCPDRLERLAKYCGGRAHCFPTETRQSQVQPHVCELSTFRPLLLLTNWNMSPPGAYSMAIARWVGVRKISLNWMMCGWQKLLWQMTSRSTCLVILLRPCTGNAGLMTLEGRLPDMRGCSTFFLQVVWRSVMHHLPSGHLLFQAGCICQAAAGLRQCLGWSVSE